MQKYIEVLKNIELFRGIEANELESLLGCLSAKLVRFDKGSTIFSLGQKIKLFGIVLSGQVQIYQEDYYGNRSIIGAAGPGQLFGESFACAEAKELPVSVLAPTDSEILFIDCEKLTLSCGNACAFHSKLIQNMLTIIANKNIALTRKIEFTSKRTTREKLLSYLSSEAQKAKGSRFSIPFNRQELADYLSVDRSAMSAELCRLRDDGLLNFKKNSFELL